VCENSVYARSVPCLRRIRKPTVLRSPRVVAIFIGEPSAPLSHLPPQDTILFDQKREHLPFPTVQSTGDGEKQHPERRGVDHGREPTSSLRSRRSQSASAEMWDTSPRRIYPTKGSNPAFHVEGDTKV